MSPVPNNLSPNFTDNNSTSNLNLLKTATSASARSSSSGQQQQQQRKKDLVDDDNSVTPSNLERVLTNPSISSEPPASSASKTLTDSPGYRAAEAFVRPHPVAAAGTVVKYGFDLAKCVFNLRIKPGLARDGKKGETVVFLPEYHFPKEQCTVEVSSGKWEIGDSSNEMEAGEGGVAIQRLRWWCSPDGDGNTEEWIRVTGVVKRHNAGGAGEGAVGRDVGYIEQCTGAGFSSGAGAANQGSLGNCILM